MEAELRNNDSICIENFTFTPQFDTFQQLLQIMLQIAAPCAASHADHNALQLRKMRSVHQPATGGLLQFQ
jgi:hypothetical protein